MKSIWRLQKEHEIRLFYLKLEKNRIKIQVYKLIQAELGEEFLKEAVKEV